MSIPTSHGLTGELADFLADGSWMTDRHRVRASELLSDTLGCVIFGAQQPWARVAAHYSQLNGGIGPSLVIGAGIGTSPPMAAFANGCAAHAFELDDVHEEAISHPGAVVIPAALAMAQSVGATGQRLLEAITVGYEAMGRVGIAVGPAAHMLAGFHPTGQSGVFGAAAAVATLLDFDAERLRHALGIAASFSSGTTEFTQSGGMSKRLHAGRAAEGGTTAALLAADGIEGPNRALDGRYGFCRIFTTEPRLHLLTHELGQRWMIDEITVKPYAACSDIHPLIEAALRLREQGIDPERIATIVADVPTKAAEQNDLDGTTSVMAAQYSGPFNIAAALLGDPADPKTYHLAALLDHRVGALQSKVQALRPAPEFDATYAWKMGGRLTVTMDDGTEHTSSVHGQLGSMHSPLSEAQRHAKFIQLSQDTVDTDALTASIRRLDSSPDIDDLCQLLSGVRLPDRSG